MKDILLIVLGFLGLWAFMGGIILLMMRIEQKICKHLWVGDVGKKYCCMCGKMYNKEESADK